MKKRILAIFGITVLMAVCLCAGAMAAGGLQQIQAYLNRDITIKLDGQTQIMYDAKGNRVYPVSYNGTTYVPIRAVSNMLGIDVDWDGPSNTVLLGKTGTAKDFIETLEPYAGNTYTHHAISDKSPEEIAGKKYDHYIKIYNSCELYYDLGYKYDTLQFDAYAPSGYEYALYFYGDNEKLLDTVDVVGANLPSRHTVDVSGTQQLKIEASISGLEGGSGRYIYIFNATIE